MDTAFHPDGGAVLAGNQDEDTIAGVELECAAVLPSVPACYSLPIKSNTTTTANTNPRPPLGL